MTNAILTFVVVGLVVFALAAATDPKLGRWLAAVIYARALAVEASREMYAVARRSGIDLRTTIVHTAEK